MGRESLLFVQVTNCYPGGDAQRGVWECDQWFQDVCECIQLTKSVRAQECVLTNAHAHRPWGSGQ